MNTGRHSFAGKLFGGNSRAAWCSHLRLGGTSNCHVDLWIRYRPVHSMLGNELRQYFERKLHKVLIFLIMLEPKISKK
jgi:hypothetical protein